MAEKPYIEKVVTTIEYNYNPKYGDNRLCECGHNYYRHFDSYESMYNVGCKYCGCGDFTEIKDVRLRHLSRVGRDNVLICDYVGLIVTWQESGGDPSLGNSDGDWEINSPDFLDHDNQLLYLYTEEQPYEKMKFDSEWNWLMPVVEMIETKLRAYSITSSGGWGELVVEWININEIWERDNSFKTNNLAIIYRGIVRYIKEFNKIANKKTE